VRNFIEFPPPQRTGTRRNIASGHVKENATNRPRIPRRDFLKACVAAGAAAGSLPAGSLFGSGSTPTLDPKGLPIMTLGKTGAVVPRFGVGSFDDAGCFAGLQLWGAVK